jgi:HPt (histidine-containing phosphotransfer) domain-containing protein
MKNAKTEEIIVHVNSMLKTLIPKFIETQRMQVKLIRSALQTSNYTALRLLGHRMKGSCGGYGFSDLGSMGAEIEKLAEACNAELLSDRVDQIESYLNKIKIEYKEE